MLLPDAFSLERYVITTLISYSAVQLALMALISKFELRWAVGSGKHYREQFLTAYGTWHPSKMRWYE